MKNGAFTTSDIAKICHHTGETVNLWLKTGKLRGYRIGTSGHWRVLPKDLALFLKNNSIPFPEPEEIGIDLNSLTGTENLPIFCWEFFRSRKITDHTRFEGGCEDCLVYEVKGINCYALRKEVDHKCIYCRYSCDKCEYFHFQQKEIQPEILAELY